MQATIGSNSQDYDEKIKKLIEDFTVMITSIMGQIKTPKFSPDNKDLPKAWYPNTVVPANKKDSLLEGGHSTKKGCMWTLKHEISLPKIYELLINTELKYDTVLDLNKFYNQINMFINVVTRIREDLITAYQSIKRHSGF